MKKSKRIALCGVISSLALVIMLLAYFPYMAFSLPAIAGALFAIVMVEIGHKWAWGGYVTTGILSLILCEKEAAMLFVGFFGFYPIVKSYLEQLPSRILEYVLKFVVFNVSIVLAYLIIIYGFGIPIEDMGDLGKYAVWVLLAFGNVVFVIYDMAISRVYELYMAKMHLKIKRILK